MGQKPEYDVLILGAGLSGLCVAHFLAKINPGLDLVVLEKDARPGGAIQTFQEDGFTAEWGAHGFLDSVAESRELLEDLNLEREIERAPLKRFVRYVCLNGATGRDCPKPRENNHWEVYAFSGQIACSSGTCGRNQNPKNRAWPSGLSIVSEKPYFLLSMLLSLALIPAIWRD